MNICNHSLARERICMLTYLHASKYERTYTHIPDKALTYVVFVVYTLTLIHTHSHTHTLTHTHTHTHTYTHTHAHTHTHTHTHIHTYILTHTRTHARTHAHTLTHTHIFALFVFFKPHFICFYTKNSCDVQNHCKISLL